MLEDERERVLMVPSDDDRGRLFFLAVSPVCPGGSDKFLRLIAANSSGGGTMIGFCLFKFNLTLVRSPVELARLLGTKYW